jgi:hypothetical protein
MLGSERSVSERAKLYSSGTRFARPGTLARTLKGFIDARATRETGDERATCLQEITSFTTSCLNNPKSPQPCSPCNAGYVSAEGSLVELLRPFYPRTEHEGRTRIQTALRSCACIEPTGEELCVTLAPLSSPHRSRAIAAVCEGLNKIGGTFPGTKLRLRFAVAQAPI